MGACSEGVFSLNVPAEALFFVGNQLIATSNTGRVGVWNAVTKHWQVASACCLMTTDVDHNNASLNPSQTGQRVSPGGGGGPSVSHAVSR